MSKASTDKRSSYGSRGAGGLRAWGFGSGLLLVLLFVVGAGFSRQFFGVGVEAQAVPSAGIRIAVVDLEAAFDASPQKNSLQDQLESEFKEKATTLETLQLEIQKLEQSKALVKVGSEQHLSYQEQIAVKTTRLRVAEERFTKELDRRRAESFDQIYAEIKTITNRVAQSLGIDLVIQRRLTIQESMPSWESVLYARDGMDITQNVIQALTEK